MYKIIKCSEVTDQEIFYAFNAGFVDYMVQIKMEEEQFISRFFGPEGNDRALSFIAFNADDKPVGVVLGGLKTDERFKTLRCGGMCVVPKERGKGLAQQLMKHHSQAAKDCGCKQLFLEVINGNDRAVVFYKKLGYEKMYDILYRTVDVNLDFTTRLKADPNLLIESISLDELKKIRTLDFSHLPWQFSFAYFEKIETTCFAVKENNQLIAGLATSGVKLLYLWVHPEYRNKSIASSLIAHSIEANKPEKIMTAYTNNAEMHLYANKLGMRLEDLSQFEMYKLLD